MPFAATWMQLEIIILSEVRNEIQEMQKGKKNAKRQNGCLRRPYKQLRIEEKLKAKEKRKDKPICMFQRTARRDKKSLPQ